VKFLSAYMIQVGKWSLTINTLSMKIMN